MQDLKYKKNNDDYESILDKKTKHEKVIHAIVFIIFAIYAISLIYPLFWLVVNSLQSSTEYYANLRAGKSFALPTKLFFSNYVDAFNALSIKMPNRTTIGLFGMFFNSIWITAVTVLGGVYMSAFTAYAVSRYKFKLRGLFYGMAIITLTVPIIGTTGSLFKLAHDVGIYNTPLYIIFTSLGGYGFNFLVLYAFFGNISQSYSEAAFIDGCGHGKVFFKIILPQARAPMLTLIIIATIACWNDYMTVLMFMPNYPTLAAGIYRVELILRRSGRGEAPKIFAALVISMVPIIVLFSVFSKTIMKNFTMGGLKG